MLGTGPIWRDNRPGSAIPSLRAVRMPQWLRNALAPRYQPVLRERDIERWLREQGLSPWGGPE